MTSLYEARGETLAAWSSHAVAAGWLAHGRAHVDPEAVAELIALEFVGGDRTLVSGVSAVPPATLVRLDARGARTTCFWPDAERWSPLDPAEARELAGERLLAGLDRRLRDAADPVVGLTAGLDSRTVAIALRELGIPFRTFSFGDPAWEDVRRAREIAERLRVPHSIGAGVMDEDAEVLPRIRRDVRWNEGLAALGPGSLPWPESMSHWVPGVGAETGRAFYYRWVVPSRRPPSPATLAHVLAARFEPRLMNSPGRVRAAVRRRVREWIDDAVAMGHRGWSALDLVYAEQRVRRWGRGMVPRVRAAYIPAYATPDLLQALASLPLEDRLTDGFQRRFVAGQDAALLPDPPTSPGRVPLMPLVRARLRVATGHARRAAGLTRRPVASPELQRSGWEAVPAYADWMMDEVLDSRLLADSLGEAWLAEVRAGFLIGEPAARQLLHLAAGPVALHGALRGLAASVPAGHLSERGR